MESQRREERRDIGEGRRSRLTILGLSVATAALMTVPGSAFGVAGDFIQPMTSPEAAGDASRGIESADFDGDLDADLAIANAESNDITILLGNGAGDFSAAPSSPVSAGAVGAWDLVAADVDNDDDKDLAVVGSTSPTGLVGIFLNDGSGNFAAPLTETVGTQPRSIAAADMNAGTDSDIDLVVGNLFPPTLNVLINDGDDDGDLTSLASEDVNENGLGSDNVINLAAAPIDNDSDNDVVIVREFTNTIRVLSNNNALGDLVYQGTAINTGDGSDVAVGNFGSNAFNDLAVAAGGGATSRVVILLGNGAGGFSAPATSPEAVGANFPAGITFDQFDGGNLDLAVSNIFPQPNTAVNILLNDGPGAGGGGGGTTTTPPTTSTPRKKCKQPKKLVKGKCRKKKKKKRK